MNKPKVIVNGDGFGASEAVNLAIVRAFDEGILTSCSLMVSGPAAAQAVELARARPRLAVGLHLVLVCGRSALTPAEIPHLVDTQGNFPYSPFVSGLRYYFSSQVQTELQREIHAQME